MLLMNNKNIRNCVRSRYNGLYLLWHSFYWFCITLVLIFEIKILNGFMLHWITNKFIRIPDVLLLLIEQATVCVSAINAFYCFMCYLISIYRSLKDEIFAESAKLNTPINKKGLQKLDESKKEDCIKSLCTFMCNFFKFSTQTSIQMDLSQTLSSTASKNSSLSSLIGYHDSPLNKSVASVHTPSQLKELLDNETCDSVIDTTDCTAFFTRDYSDSRSYRTGTAQYPSKSDTSISGIKSYFSKSETTHQRRPPRMYHRTPYSLTSTRDTNPTIHVETNIKELINMYDLNELNMEAYELKLRIWLCNTIIRPLIEKIDELNLILAEKYSNVHLRLGQSNLEEIQSHGSGLYNTFLPFILPYLRVHSNQQYVVNRVRQLSQNIALEDFKWNNGGDVCFRDVNNEFNRFICWNQQLPTDSELLWYFFCIYMDFHLSPSSAAVAAVSESSKPFSNVYFANHAKTAEEFPSALNKKMMQTFLDERFYEIFFIRMTAIDPPCFELVIDGGDTIILPAKNSYENFWLVLIFFLAHIKKSSHQRIGHAHISSLGLDIFDL